MDPTARHRCKEDPIVARQSKHLSAARHVNGPPPYIMRAETARTHRRRNNNQKIGGRVRCTAGTNRGYFLLPGPPSPWGSCQETGLRQKSQLYAYICTCRALFRSICSCAHAMTASLPSGSCAPPRSQDSGGHGNMIAHDAHDAHMDTPTTEGGDKDKGHAEKKVQATVETNSGYYDEMKSGDAKNRRSSDYLSRRRPEA